MKIKKRSTYMLVRVTINCLSLAFHSSMRSGGKEACRRKEKKEKLKMRRKQSVKYMNSLVMI